MARTAANYIKNAEECRRLARMLNMPEHREALLEMAATWEKLATERTRNTARAARAAKQPGIPFVSPWPKND
jgi:hypothetical protein